ncbi:MAG: hypothetical protein KME12_25780 [Trichocoleus desertorum ATA4-8-CV12]|jgi:hypothetical protein|nr:hypothetical protein [Trichocoleus desertorum ATA4-8-CV12]
MSLTIVTLSDRITDIAEVHSFSALMLSINEVAHERGTNVFRQNIPHRPVRPIRLLNRHAIG